MTKQEIRERDIYIVEDHMRGYDGPTLAKKYSLHSSGITRILQKAGINVRAEQKRKQQSRDRSIFFESMQGDSIKTIATRHGISLSRVTQILREQGIFTKEKIEAEHDRIIELLQGGMSRRLIAEHLKTRVTKVAEVARKRGFGWIAKEIKCKVCAGLFTPSVPRQVCCSQDCSAINAKQIKGGIRIVWSTCKMCGARYKMMACNAWRQEFCSIKCSKKWPYIHQEVRNKEIWYLRHIQGLTYARIGAIFDLSPTTVRYHYFNQIRTRSEAALKYSIG